jgi:hypothetical protein
VKNKDSHYNFHNGTMFYNVFLGVHLTWHEHNKKYNKIKEKEKKNEKRCQVSSYEYKKKEKKINQLVIKN